VAPLEPWEKVLVNYEEFSQTIHGKQTCIECHGGQPAADKEQAHTGLIASPSLDAQTACGACHQDITTSYETSLHNTQAGYWTALNARSLPEDHETLNQAFGNHCATCHTTCGECHINQPDNVGGGLFNGHLFEKTPPMTRACTACHGSRVGNEFLGKNEELPGDVHFRQERMNCIKCHSGVSLHASAAPADHRYAGAQVPACTDCHADLNTDNNLMHAQHGQQLQCQVCHSITYTSCDGCHVAISETSGNPFFETQATYPTFVIGRNPRQSEERPYEYVLLRHVPVAPTSFEYYGENLLPNFDSVSTWQYATPHNIQLNTPQNASCEACHGNPNLFLTADKVAPEELAANANVIVAGPPSMSGSPDPEGETTDTGAPVNNGIPVPPANHTGLIVCNICHSIGAGDAPVNPPSHEGREDSTCTSCHPLPEE